MHVYILEVGSETYEPSWLRLYGILDFQLHLLSVPIITTRLWVRIPLMRGVLATTLCDKVCQ